jgi:hypothetical protein
MRMRFALSPETSFDLRYCVDSASVVIKNGFVATDDGLGNNSLEMHLFGFLRLPVNGTKNVPVTP